MPVFIDSIKPLLNVHPALATNLRELSDKVDQEVYLVGGCIRDAMLGRIIRDLDLTLLGDGLRFAEALAARLRSPFVPLYDANRTGRVVLHRRYTIDIASFKGATLEEDLSKRDFTVNAMAVKLLDALDGYPSMIDPCNGAKDLASKQLKAISSDSFQEDPLRMLRAHRLASQYNLDIIPETMTWINEYKEGLSNLPGERVRHEIILMLNMRSTVDRIYAMIETGLWGVLFPEWKGQGKIALVRKLERTDRLIARDVFFKDYGLYLHLPQYAADFTRDRSSLWILRLSSFVLHLIREKSRAEEYTIVDRAANRLKLSNRESLVLHQLTLGAKRLLETFSGRVPNDVELCRILGSAKEETPGVALLALAHGFGATSETLPEVGNVVDRLLKLYNRYRIVQAEGLLLNGMDIMSDLKISEGPDIGRMLDILENIQILHDIQTKEEARKLLYTDPKAVVKTAR